MALEIVSVTAKVTGASIQGSVIDAIAYAMKSNCPVHLYNGTRFVRIDAADLPFGNDLFRSVRHWVEELIG